MVIFFYHVGFLSKTSDYFWGAGYAAAAGTLLVSMLDSLKHM
jgi:hypothetical protein